MKQRINFNVIHRRVQKWYQTHLEVDSLVSFGWEICIFQQYLIVGCTVIAFWFPQTSENIRYHIRHPMDAIPELPSWKAH